MTEAPGAYRKTRSRARGLLDRTDHSQVPPLHVPEQQSAAPAHGCPSVLQLVHVPLVHWLRPPQQSLADLQLPPGGAQDCGAHWPPAHVLEQHWLSSEHAIPLPLHDPAGPHLPPLHSVEQHSDASVHEKPFARQLAPFAHMPSVQLMEQHSLSLEQA